jgi:hypothetical protein
MLLLADRQIDADELEKMLAQAEETATEYVRERLGKEQGMG